MITSELYTINILSFISTGRAERGRTNQHKVVRSGLPICELAGKAGRPSSWQSTLLGGNDVCNLLLDEQQFSECLVRLMILLRLL